MKTLWMEWLGAIAFYTCLPIPPNCPMQLAGAAKWCPWVGLLLAVLLWGTHQLLAFLHVPPLVASVLVVALWLGLTGGLHLDGAMDTADGLAVRDQQRRLEVMADSRTGAFGVMAGLVILLLKVAALSSLERGQVLVWVLVIGRLAQVWAIARYPYLKPQGTGQIHKASCAFPRDFWPSGLLVLLLSFLLPLPFGQLLFGLLLIPLIPAWFQWQLGGHTGDTYGAVVEWTEALMLVAFTVASTS
ncbi:adenosylcobinamide-GDP ribazoletransferase [Thermosynechococcus sp. PKX82]|uniref:adenosylcobinamide-GDP ribazoletransferase n=1 Tax=Thermosynechococcus sp. PKX82 TaxID=3074086 RepID=UPI002872D2DD|nr:adenosylcobinamide-GDP ribazoletransferase [Thermosynechococcus sp. PKX82]WNC30582.1 adenosylcobinamide-GDP ribazoletransferase [Thermosynechococcus sp. PKX82]